jgi:hypothetical protein
MTKLFEQAIETARRLPPEIQDDIASVVLALAGNDQPVVQLAPEEELSLAKSRAQAARREFASDEQVQAVWSKHRP